MMNIRNAKQDIQYLLSCFSEVFSRPSFKLFSSFIIGFIQLGKETHTSSMVQSLSFSFLHRSLSSFTRFLGQNVWAVEEVAETVLEQFFHTLQIKTYSVLFLIVDDSIILKERRDGVRFRPRSPWPKRCSKPFDSLSLVKSIFWRIAGIGQNSWLKFVGSMVTI